MIRITRQGETAVSLEGHAGSDVYGRDLVCAAVSALVLTLAANVEGMEGAEIFLEAGNSQVQCGLEAAEVFDCVCKGFALLAKKYPDYVCFTEA